MSFLRSWRMRDSPATRSRSASARSANSGTRRRRSRVLSSLRAATCGLRDRLLQEHAQGLGAAGMAELSQGLALDLPDPLAGDRERLPDLLEGVLTSVADPEPELQDLLLP